MADNYTTTSVTNNKVARRKVFSLPLLNPLMLHPMNPWKNCTLCISMYVSLLMITHFQLYLTWLVISCRAGSLFTYMSLTSILKVVNIVPWTLPLLKSHGKVSNGINQILPHIPLPDSHIMDLWCLLCHEEPDLTSTSSPRIFATFTFLFLLIIFSPKRQTTHQHNIHTLWLLHFSSNNLT
jgi:hypothetical protein